STAPARFARAGALARSWEFTRAEGDMLELIFAVSPIAVGIAVSPLPLVSLLVTLLSGRSRENAVAFTVGWLLAMMIVGGLALFVMGGLSAPGTTDPPSSSSLAVRGALGAALLPLAALVWRNRPAPGREQELPRWLGAIDRLSPPLAFAIGFGTLALNPKNL